MSLPEKSAAELQNGVDMGQMGVMKLGNDKFDFVFIFFYFSTNIEARTQMLLICRKNGRYVYMQKINLNLAIWRSG